MHSAYTTAKHTGKELGFINSVFTLIGFIGGAISPIPAGSILGAEGMLKASKFIGKHINKAVGKNLDKIA